MPSANKNKKTSTSGRRGIMQDVEHFAEILRRLHISKTVEIFKDLELRVAESHHPLASLLPGHLCTLPCMIARSKDPTKLAAFRDRVSSQKTRNPSSASSGCDSVSDFTLEGSPLKLQEITDINTSGDFPVMRLLDSDIVDQRPASVTVARKILSYYNLIQSSLKLGPNDVLQDAMPLWVVTDGKDLDKIAYFGTIKIQDVIKCVRVSCSALSSGKNISIKKMKAEHLNCMKSKEYSEAYGAIYEVVKMIDPETHESHGSIKLEYDWENAQQFLDLPPLDARVKVVTRIKPGDRSSPANQQFQQLSTLKMFSKGLTTQHICWAFEENDVPLLDTVKELFKKCTDPTVRLSEQREDNCGEDATASIDQLKVLRTRQDMDFTEKLWDVLIECTSYQDLKEALSYIYTALRRVESLPWISPNNKTKLAQFIVDCDKNSNQSMPHLEGLVPLEILIELGVNKIRQDYVEFFISQDFIQPHDLEYYKDASLSIQEQITQLEKLHHALELFLATKHHLHLHGTYLAAMARLALSHYKTHHVDPDHVFSLSIAAKTVRKIIEGCAPSRWEMKLTSNCRLTGKVGHWVCIAVSEPVISHIPMTSANGNNDITRSDSDKTIFQFLVVKESYSPIF